jgi:hypothetical protein
MNRPSVDVQRAKTRSNSPHFGPIFDPDLPHFGSTFGPFDPSFDHFEPIFWL